MPKFINSVSVNRKTSNLAVTTGRRVFQDIGEKDNTDDICKDGIYIFE